MRPCLKETGSADERYLTTYSYDGAGRLTRSEERNADGTLGIATTCEYDPAGRPRACPTNSFRRAYEFAKGQLVRVTVTSTERKSVEVETFEYDDRGRLTVATIREADQPAQKERYHYDAAGRLTWIESADRPQEFSYDSSGRLIKVSGVMAKDIAYDATERVREILDFLTVEPGRWVFEYDASGRLVNERRENDGWLVHYRYVCD
ncbi:MAG: hypothetical protein H0T42_02965 [Deltaproteobacteria bacterium]|nr:hypothetical protein [Deltaproteobacteria bacterium]